ncbi:MAG: sialate O-acetylesterase [Planctomycetota bacterium]|nr:sialate O-acetylesterase [Planctomycetota bacterium]
MQSNLVHSCLFLVLLFAGTKGVLGGITMPAIFSDHMVLQCNMETPVWGWAEPGEAVTVSIDQQSKQATANADGKWMVRLEPMASGAATTLTIRGTNEVVIRDVVVGEVWLGSGQSNMAMTVKASNNFGQEQSFADLPMIRMFKEESAASNEEQQIGKGKWLVCTPDSVGGFSAVLFFFGREIHNSLKAPVGLINSSVGGTPIESWIAADVQRHSKSLQPFFEEQSPAASAPPTESETKKYEQDLAKWAEAAKKARAENQKLPRKPTDPTEVRNRKGNVGGLFNGKIAPLIPYAMRGALWYQGEANSFPAKAPFYEHQLPLLIQDWRSRWRYDFPFAWAQLPNFEGEGRDWPTIREAMLKSLSIPKTGMGINIDIGDKKDIHPKNKQEVGRRLSLWALGTVYGQPVAATSGPLPLEQKIRGNEVVISFQHANGGLVASDGTVKGFLIAGENMEWKSANARIEGNTVIVSSPEVTNPIAVRYAWENFPDCNLYNGAGLPASPFRTDKSNK